jgi:hypothetical protein
MVGSYKDSMTIETDEIACVNLDLSGSGEVETDRRDSSYPL